MRNYCFLSCLFFLLGISLFAEAPHEFPVVQARSAILLDASTGTILYEKAADESIPPASLTKLMTIHLLLEAVSAGKLKLDQEVPIPEEAWASKQSEGSSLMFLGPGQRVNVRELLLGLAVCSGNDAAVAAADLVSGSIPAFVTAMNDEASRLGLSATHFAEPSGISEQNRTTAREYARFCRFYLQQHPNVTSDYHSQLEFTYPQPGNIVLDTYATTPIRQFNRNGLLGKYDGADGLKTGFINESGFNFALTARRENTRFLAIILGGPGSSISEGSKIRDADGRRLLDWGFANYHTVWPEVQSLEALRIWGGREKTVGLTTGSPPSFTAETSRAHTVQWRIEKAQGVKAPVSEGQRLGEIIFYDEIGELSRTPIVAAGTVEKGNIFRRMADAIVLFFSRIQ